jgi:hypothetical protein
VFLNVNIYLDIFPIGYMEEWVRRIVSEEKKKRGIMLEPKLLNGNYSVCHY